MTDLFDPPAEISPRQEAKDRDKSGAGPQASLQKTSACPSDNGSSEPLSLEQVSFYSLFLLKLEPLCRDEAKTADELVQLLELQKQQLNLWLKRAVVEKQLTKLYKPVRYQWRQTQEQQQSLF